MGDIVCLKKPEEPFKKFSEDALKQLYPRVEFTKLVESWCRVYRSNYFYKSGYRTVQFPHTLAGISFAIDWLQWSLCNPPLTEDTLYHILKGNLKSYTKATGERYFTLPAARY